ALTDAHPSRHSLPTRRSSDLARKTAGSTWSDEFHFFCEAPRPNRPDDPPIAPTQLFDDVFAIGNSGTTVYMIRTSAGLVLLDALDRKSTRLNSSHVKISYAVF